MSEEGVERKLTTILAADVVGYSRLMAADEAGTLAQLKTHRKELIEPKTAKYSGRVIKLMGDGTLMEFGSVVDAVHFAVDVQRAMALRNTDVPADQRDAAPNQERLGKRNGPCQYLATMEPIWGMSVDADNQRRCVNKQES